MALLAPRVWGRRAGDLELRFEGRDLGGLLRPGANVSSVVVQPTLGNDHIRLETIRRANREWLQPWEATLPPGSSEPLPTWREYARKMDRQMREGRGLAMTTIVDGKIAGAVTVGAVQEGALSSGILGYWIAQEQAGRGVTSLAVAAVIDLVIGTLGLHRLEINVRPDNEPSLGVCRRLGLRQEAYKPRYMNIAGKWCDHIGFAVDREDLEQTRMITALGDSRL